MNKKIKNPALQAAGKKGAAVRYGQDYGGPRLEDMPRDAEGKIPDLREAGRRAAEIKYSRQRLAQKQAGQQSLEGEGGTSMESNFSISEGDTSINPKLQDVGRKDPQTESNFYQV
uniref:Uncharacterized protein n=1 Tax=Acrobeloides nanus TaxID=290746 RepID=A0A914CFB2_9BILA